MQVVTAYLTTHTTALPIQLLLVSSIQIIVISVVLSPLFPIILSAGETGRVCALRTDYITAKQL